MHVLLAGSLSIPGGLLHPSLRSCRGIDRIHNPRFTIQLQSSQAVCNSFLTATVSSRLAFHVHFNRYLNEQSAGPTPPEWPLLQVGSADFIFYPVAGGALVLTGDMEVAGDEPRAPQYYASRAF